MAGFLNIYGQEEEGNPVRIVGNKEALNKLIDALIGAIKFGNEKIEMETWVPFQAAYPILIICDDRESKENRFSWAPQHYSFSGKNDNPDKWLSPESVFESVFETHEYRELPKDIKKYDKKREQK